MKAKQSVRKKVEKVVASSGSDRLVSRYTKYDHHDLNDILKILAANIEDSLLEAGAVPGKDYVYRDLYSWAVQLLPTVTDVGQLSYFISWPAPEKN